VLTLVAVLREVAIAKCVQRIDKTLPFFLEEMSVDIVARRFPHPFDFRPSPPDIDLLFT
jgi:hypothetical protein